MSDETGTITTEYTYGSYGELLSGDRSQTKFRYNGIYGVISDENGLYYMRARYYNVDIRRFINQDIIRGNVSESQSLNRYNYVQGNPVNLVDPFGLSPYMSWKDMGHTVLDVLGFIPGIGDVFDIANAVWYAAEGNWAMAGISFMSAIPFVGSFLGSGVKLTFKGIDLGCAIAQGSKIIGYGYNTVRAGEQAGNGAIQMIRRYAVEGKEVGWHTVGEAGEVLLFSALTVMSGKASVSAAGQKVSGGVVGEGVSGAKSLFDKGKDVFKKFNPNDAYVKPKHLSTSGGNGAKFLGGSKVESEVILREGLKNGTIKTIADNGITKLGSQSYEIIVDAGKVVGTKGETLIKVVLSEDGGMLSAYPAK